MPSAGTSIPSAPVEAAASFGLRHGVGSQGRARRQHTPAQLLADAQRRIVVEDARGDRLTSFVVEYLIREKVPYLFGYAGHGAVGLLDGVYDRQDEIKVVFPRIETGAGYMADAYFRVSHEVIPVYTSTGPGPMLLTAAISNAFYDSSAFIAITGQVATSQYDSGALQEEYRHFQADFPRSPR